ncbi:MAG: hypothetical protein ABFD90_08510 [Phycisphaerales bacterium]
MLKLIAREICDHIAYFGACCVLSAIIVATLICMIVYEIVGTGVLIACMVAGLLFLGFGILGVGQMCGDRVNRVSTFLSTQAVTRNRILIARILAGVVTIVSTLVPALVLAIILLKLKKPPLEFYSQMVWDISAVLLLGGVACHSLGLLVGWTGSKARLIAGFPCLMLLLPSLVAVKGFGPSTAVLLTLLIMVVWGWIWHTFTSASL